MWVNDTLLLKILISFTNLLACRTLVASGYQNGGWPLPGALLCYLLSAETSKLSSFRWKGAFCIWHLTDASLGKFKLIEKWIYLFYFVFNIVIYVRFEFLAVHHFIEGFFLFCIHMMFLITGGEFLFSKYNSLLVCKVVTRKILRPLTVSFQFRFAKQLLVFTWRH